MIDYLLRPEPTTTLGDLQDVLRSDGGETVLVQSSDIVIDSSAGLVRFEDKSGTSSYEVPFNMMTTDLFSDWLDIPKPFIRRQDLDLQDYLFHNLLERNPGDMVFEFGEQGITEIRNPRLERINPLAVINIAAGVVGVDAVVLDGWRTSGEYRFDVLVADGSDRAIGGDTMVNDITKGGLRFGQSTKQRLAPWVQTILYRLVCTNGMEVPGMAPKVTMKGHSMDEVMRDLEFAAQEAFGAVEAQIDAFYDLRNQEVGDASQIVARIANERGLGAKITTEMIERLPALMEDTTNASMFDIVNAVTNMANHDDLVDKPDRQRKIQVAGGTLIKEHAERCPRCQAALI